MKILVVSPWPDGPEMIAGTIVKETGLGHEVHVLCLSKGAGIRSDISPDEEEEIRMNEQRMAASIEGVKEVHFLDMKVLNIFDNSESRRAVVEVIRRIKPKMIIMPWFRDTHPDIEAQGQIVLAACFMATLPIIETQEPPHIVEIVYMFETPASIDFEPDFYVDITDVIEIKKEAIRQHKGLARMYESGDVEDVLETYTAGDAARGVRCGEGVRYAEAFKRWTYPHGAKYALDHLPV